MKMLILAAGYATRLYPLTKNFPKPLLEVKGKTIIDHMLSNMNCGRIEQIIVVTNHRFVECFEQWKSASILKNLLSAGQTFFTNRARIAFKIARIMTPTSAKIAAHIFAIPRAPRARQINFTAIANTVF